MIGQESQDGPERAVRPQTSIPALVPKREDLWPDLEAPDTHKKQHNLIEDDPQTPRLSRPPSEVPTGEQQHTARDSDLRQGSTIGRSHSNPSPETAGDAHADRGERSGQDQLIFMREAPQQAEDLAAARQVKDSITEDHEKKRAIRRLIRHASQRNAFDIPSERTMPFRVSDKKDSTPGPDAPDASGYVQISEHPGTRHSMASNTDEGSRYSIGRSFGAIEACMPEQQMDILHSREDRLSKLTSGSSTQSPHSDVGRLDDASGSGVHTPNANVRSFLRRTASQTPVTPGKARTAQAQSSHEDEIRRDDALGGGHHTPSVDVRSFLRRIETQTPVKPGTAHTPQTDYRAGLKHGTAAVQGSLRKMTSSPARLREAPKSALDHSRHRSPNPLEDDCGYCDPQDVQPSVPGSPTTLLDDVRSVSPAQSYHTAGSSTSSRLLRRAGKSTASLRTLASASASASVSSSIRAPQPSSARPPHVTLSRTRTIRPSASVGSLLSPNHTGKAGTSLPPQPEPSLPSRHSDPDCEQQPQQQQADLAGAIDGLKAAIASETGQLQSKVGDSTTTWRQRTGGGEREENEAGIQTDGTLVLIRGITVTLHMRDERDDLVLRADLEGRGLGVGGE